MAENMEHRNHLKKALEYYECQRFAACREACKSLLRRDISDDIALDVFIMLAKIGGPEALDYSIEANRLARELLDQNQGNDDLVEVFYLTQDILRKEQAKASAAKDRPVVGHQTATKVSYIEQDGTRKIRTTVLCSINEEEEGEEG